MSKRLGVVYLSDNTALYDEVIDSILKYFNATSCLLIGDNLRGLLIESDKFPLVNHGCPLTYCYLQSIDPIILTEGKYMSSVGYFELTK